MFIQWTLKTTFLNGDLKHKVCMKQTEGFILSINEKIICK